eukprot:5023673-Ditylum_brightwellii.AAC.1
MLKSCEVTVKDITTTFKIFGPSTASLKGKSTTKKCEEVVMDQVLVPRSVLRDHRKLTVLADIMCVNKIPFLMSIFHHISFKTVQRLMTRTKESLFNAIKNAISVYSKCSFIVNVLIMDPEFNALAEEVTGMSIYYNPNLAKEKVPRIERQIR